MARRTISRFTALVAAVRRVFPDRHSRAQAPYQPAMHRSTYIAAKGS